MLKKSTRLCTGDPVDDVPQQLLRARVDEMEVLGDDDERLRLRCAAHDDADRLERAPLALDHVEPVSLELGCGEREQVAKVGLRPRELGGDRLEALFDLLLLGRLRLPFFNPEDCPQQIGDEMERRRLRLRPAARLNVHRRVIAQATAELVSEARLPGARLSDERHGLATSFTDACEVPFEGGQLAGSSDERRESTIERRFEASTPTPRSRHRERSDRSREPFEIEEPRSVVTKWRSTSRCVASLTRTPPGSAALCNLAARFTVSPCAV